MDSGSGTNYPPRTPAPSACYYCQVKSSQVVGLRTRCVFPKIFFEQSLEIFDAHRLGNFLDRAIFCANLQNFPMSNLWRTSVSWSDLPRTSSPTSKFFFEQSLTHIGWEIFLERSSTDFFSNFQNFSLSNLWRTSAGKFSWSNLRRTSSPTSKFFFEQPLTNIGWEIFLERSSTDYFANLQTFSLSNLWRILAGKFSWSDLRRTSSPTFKNFSLSDLWRTSVVKFSRSDLRGISSPTCKIFLWAIFDAYRLASFSLSLTDLAGSKCHQIGSISIITTDVLAYHRFG